MLLVGVDGDRDRTLNAQVRDAIEGVVARTSAPDDEDPWIGNGVLRHLVVHEGGRPAMDRVVAELVHDVMQSRMSRTAHPSISAGGSHPTSSRLERSS